MKEKKAKMPSNEAIRAAADKCPVAADTLKELWPEAFEEEIENGQIYQVVANGACKGEFYLLISVEISNIKWWKLVSLKCTWHSWSNWRNERDTKAALKTYFALCHAATIKVTAPFRRKRK